MPVFQLVVHGADHASVFELVKAATGAGKDEHGKAGVAEDEQLHVAPEGGGRPLVIFAFHCLPSASLMPSYFTGAVFLASETVEPNFLPACVRARTRINPSQYRLCRFRERF